MKLKFWIGIAISLGLLAYLFSMIDFARLWETIKAVNPYYTAAAGLINLAGFGVRAVRWRYLMEPVKKRVPLGSLFSATMIGFMANNVLPARLGEFVRAYVIGRREDVPKSSAFATVVVERLFDTMSVLLLLIITLVYMPVDISGAGMAGTLRKAGAASLAAYIVMIAVIAFFVYRPEALGRLARAVTGRFSAKWAGKAGTLADRFINGLSVVKDPRLLVMILFYSAVLWGMLILPGWLFFKAFGLDNLGAYPAVFLLVAACFSVALPSTPGFVGTFHAGATGALVLLGVEPGVALGYAILLHAISFIPVTLIGLAYLYRENLTLGGIRKAEA